MSIPVAILNYATLKNNKLVLYTETKHNYVVGDYIYINGGFYDNTENLINNIYNYNKDIINGTTTIFNDNILSYVNGYKIIGFDPMLPAGYNFIIDYGYDNQNEVIYPYGDITNQFGRLDISNDGFRDKTAGRAYNKIYTHTNALICGNVQNSTINENLIGVRDNNDTQTFYKCDEIFGIKRITDSIILQANIDSCIISSTTTTQLTEHAVVDEYIDTAYPVFKFQYMGVINNNENYSYITKIENCNIKNSMVNFIDFYNPTPTAVFDSVIFASSKICRSTINDVSHELNVIGNSNFNNCHILKGKFIGGPIGIDDCNIQVKSVVDDIEIINIQHDSSNTYSTIELKIPTQNIIKYNSISTTEYYYSFLGYLPSNLTRFDYTNSVKLNIEQLPNKVSISSMNVNQMSKYSNIILKFSSKLPSDDISDYILDPEKQLKLYFDESKNKFNDVFIYNSTIDTSILTNQNILSLENNFFGGFYDYLNIDRFNCLALGVYNIIRLFRNNKYMISEYGSTNNIDNNEVRFTYINSVGTLYIKVLRESYLHSVDNTNTIQKHGINIIGADIHKSIIEDCFLYHCNIIKSKIKRCMWDMCAIYDSSNTNNGVNFKHIYNATEMLNNELLLETYIDERTTTLPYQNHEPITNKLSIDNKSRNIKITKTNVPTIYDPATTYNGDLTNYAGGLYNSAIYKSNYNNVFTLDLPILKNVINDLNGDPYINIPLDLKNNGYPTSIVDVTSIAISGKDSYFRDANKILCLNHVRNFSPPYGSIVDQYKEYFTKANATVYNPDSSLLDGTNPATISSSSVFELNDYKVDQTFEKTDTLLNFPDLLDEKIYAFNLIDGPVKYNDNFVVIRNVIDISDLPLISDLIPTITFNAGGTDISNTGIHTEIPSIHPEIPNKLRYTDTEINSGLNSIKLTFDNTKYQKLVAGDLYAPEMLYEIERIYIYNENDNIGESYVLRNTITDIYTLSDQLTLLDDTQEKILKTDDGLNIFKYNFNENKSYIVYLDVWITPHYVWPNLFVDYSFGPNTNYNSLELTGMNGSTTFKNRLMVRVNTTASLFYIVDHRNSSDSDRFVLTDTDEKIIIL